MRSLIAASLLLALAVDSSAASGAASISWTARLTPEMSACIKLRAPNFKIWSASDFYKGILDDYSFTSRQTPSIVTGDFNGDSTDDVAIAGRDQDRSKVIAIFVGENKCDVFEILNRPYEDPSKMIVDMGNESGSGLIEYLGSAHKGKKSSSFEKHVLDLKSDAIIINVFGKASTLYYLKKGVFKTFALAD